MNNEKKSESSLAHIKSKIKVVFLGDQSTGKTSILLRYMHDKFEDTQVATVGIDFMAKNITVNSTNLRLQLWDTAGQERFRSLIPSYLKDATVTFLVFGVNNRKSFQNVREWIELCNQSRSDKSIMMLIGNKCDLQNERQVTIEEAVAFAANEEIKYFEVSAKTNKNIKQIFVSAAEDYVQQTFGNEVTIGNIENFHVNYANNIKGKEEKAATIELNTNPIMGVNQQKKSCC